MNKITVKCRNVERTIDESLFDMYKEKGYKKVDTVSNDNGAGEETPKSLKELTVQNLKEIAKTLEIDGFSNLNKDELIAVIEAKQLENEQ